MKNYNKILEAVNRGIQLALDDFDDEDQVLNNVKSKQINHRDYTKEYLDLMNEVVDLGLPSGTLWCKYNLDVDPTQLSKPDDWYGDYYAWGELEGNKPGFRWINYKFGKAFDNLTKYCNRSSYGLKRFTDNLTELLPEDDVAYQNKKLHNFKFHIPTKDQCEELINYTNRYWVNNYDPNKIKHTADDGGIQGLNGRIFEGKNRNQLFIPAAGYHSGSDTNSVGTFCFLWSSSLHLANSSNAYNIYFYLNTIGMANNCRYCGFSIRPVIKL